MFKYFNYLISIFFDENGGTLAMTRKTSNTLITASGFNTNYDQVEAVVNGGIEATNLASAAVTAVKIAGSAFRTGYGVKQHTDSTIMVEIASSSPGLSVAGSGLTAVVTGIATLQSGGIDGGRAGDMILSSNTNTPSGWTDISTTYANKFIRISATALTAGGADTHTHTGTTDSHVLTIAQMPAHTHTYSITGAAGSGTSGGDVGSGGTTGSTGGGGGHTHGFTTGSGNNVPAFITSKLYKKD